MRQTNANRKRTAAQEAERAATEELDRQVLASLGINPSVAMGPLPHRREIRALRTELRPESNGLINSAVGILEPSLGPGSRRVLREELQEVLQWAQAKHDTTKGTFEAFAGHLIRSKVSAFYRRISWEARRREKLDEVERAAAATNEASLAKYLDYAARLLKRSQLAWPNRWRVPTRDPGDVIGDVLVDLIAFINDEMPWEIHETRAGVPATVLFAEKRCRNWRKRREIYDLTDKGILPEDLAAPTKTPEAIVSGWSSADHRNRALAAAKTHMSRIQRGWLAEMRADAHWNDKLNEARVARQMDRSRSAAGKIKLSVRTALELVGYDPDEDLGE